jgi:HK97 family phage major capsid protein
LLARGIDLKGIGTVYNDSGSTGAVENEVTIPDSPAALEELMHDSKRMRAVFSKGLLPDLVKAYARNVMQKDQEIAAQVRDEVQKTLAEFLKSNEAEGLVRPDLAPVAQTARDHKDKLYNPRALGASLDKEFQNSADFFRTIWHGQNRDAATQAKISKIRNAWSSSVPSEGGFLIPETVRSEMLRVALETSIVRPRARVIPMDTLRVPFPAVDSTTNATSVYGGIICYWTAEGATMTASNPGFARVTLEAKKLTAYTEAPNELIADSISSFEAYINELYPEAVGFYEDDAYLNGTGVGEPLGMLADANGALVEVAKETNQPATSIVWENIVKMYSRMLPQSLNRAVWLCAPDTFPELATMALSVGTGGGPVWLNNGIAGPPATILGRPVIVTEKCATLGTKTDIAFVDPAFYLVGDRQAMSATSSPHFKFSSDVTAFRIVQRVDGQPWLLSDITPANASTNTLSAYVTLATRA